MLSNIRPITVLESTYRLFTNMVSKRVTILFHKYNIIPPAQHACLIGRGATMPIMQMNAAMEHTIDQNRNPDIYTEMEYLPRNSDTWEVAEIMALQKNGKYTIRQKHRRTYKTTRGIAREQLRYEKKEKDHLHLLLTDLAACYDCIPYTTIQLCVTRIGLPDNFLKLIRGLQEQQHRSLRFNGNPPSPLVLLTGGLAQGCGLSCILLVCITAAIITYTQDRTNK